MDTYGDQLNRIVSTLQRAGFSSSLRGEGKERFVYVEHSGRAVELSHDGVGFLLSFSSNLRRSLFVTTSRTRLSMLPSRPLIGWFEEKARPDKRLQPKPDCRFGSTLNATTQIQNQQETPWHVALRPAAHHEGLGLAPRLVTAKT